MKKVKCHSEGTRQRRVTEESISEITKQTQKEILRPPMADSE